MEKNFNLKLILLFAPAFWFISEGGELLGLLANTSLAEQLRTSDLAITNPQEFKESAFSIVKLSIASGFAGWIALVLSMVLALLIGKKKKWNWVNAVTALVLVYAGSWMDMDPFRGFMSFLMLPGEQFSGAMFYVVNAMVLIGIGGIILMITALTIPKAKPEPLFVA